MSQFSARYFGPHGCVAGRPCRPLHGVRLRGKSIRTTPATGRRRAEFLLLGAGARGAALGTAFAAIATDPSALYYNPAGIALMPRAGAMISTYDYVADTRYSWGGIAFPFSGGCPSHWASQVGTFGFKDQPVYTAEQPDGTGSVYSVSETSVGLTFAQNFSDRFSAGITAKGVFDNLGEASGKAFAVDFGTNFHSELEQPPDQFCLHHPEYREQSLHSGSALQVTSPRDSIPGEQPVPQNPQPSDSSTPRCPSSSGSPWPTISSPAREPARRCCPISTSPTTTVPASPPVASGRRRNWAARPSALPSGAAIVISRRTILVPPIPILPPCPTKRICTDSRWAAGSTTAAATSIWGWITPGKDPWACSGERNFFSVSLGW